MTELTNVPNTTTVATHIALLTTAAPITDTALTDSTACTEKERVRKASVTAETITSVPRARSVCAENARERNVVPIVNAKEITKNATGQGYAKCTNGAAIRVTTARVVTGFVCRVGPALETLIRRNRTFFHQSFFHPDICTIIIIKKIIIIKLIKIRIRIIIIIIIIIIINHEY